MPLSSLKATEATLSLPRPCPVRWRMARRDQEPPPLQRLGSESSAVAAEKPDGWGEGTLGCGRGRRRRREGGEPIRRAGKEKRRSTATRPTALACRDHNSRRALLRPARGLRRLPRAQRGGAAPSRSQTMA